ncbi:MAG: hypothetical protein WCF04_10495 [Candidatus Nanopelagicales bacterium]
MADSTAGSGAGAAEEPGHEQENLAYLRTLYADVLRWYSVADSKAQVILTLNGVLIAFSSSNLLGGKEAAWSGWTLALPWAAALCLAGALYFAIDALHSNLLEAQLRSATPDIDFWGSDPASRVNAWWFGHLATMSRTADEASTTSRRDSLAMYLPMRLRMLPPPPRGSHLEAVDSMLLGIDAGQERRVLSAEIVALSVHVLEKHRSVNRGWVASGLALILILLAAATADQ